MSTDTVGAGDKIASKYPIVNIDVSRKKISPVYSNVYRPSNPCLREAETLAEVRDPLGALNAS